MKLSLLPANILCGELTLEALVNGSCVKIWTNSAKAVEVTLPKTWTLGADTIPSSLWIDGISAGQVVLDLYYKDTSGTEIGRDKVAVYVTKTVSRSPSGTFAYGWEPCGWFGTGTGGQGSNTPETVLNNVVSQGWNIVTARYRDGSYLNDAVESCTLANFKGMSLGGLIEVSTHGNAALIAACYTLTYAAASNWMAGESNMFVAVAEECAGMHGVYALIPWFESNWKPGLDTGDAISMFMSCHGATNGANSLVNRAGGRVKYGYVPSPAHTNMRSNNNMLFGRMNGSVDGGSRRCAGEAYEGGTDYADDLRMFGNDWTTLCPAPLAVFPASSPGSRKGWGCIIFDTYMDDSYAAAQAVTKLSGSCGVSNFRWVDNGSGKYCLGFNFDNTGGGGATMRAHADKCKNDCDGDLGRKLDGNRIQENEDDRDWTF